MTFAIEHGFARGTPAALPLEGEPFIPDWHGLRARFAASHAAMRVLNRTTDRATRDDANPALRGSFDQTSARLLDAYPHGLSSVNPDALAHGKLVETIIDAADGASRADG